MGRHHVIKISPSTECIYKNECLLGGLAGYLLQPFSSGLLYYDFMAGDYKFFVKWYFKSVKNVYDYF